MQPNEKASLFLSNVYLTLNNQEEFPKYNTSLKKCYRQDSMPNSAISAI